MCVGALCGCGASALQPPCPALRPRTLRPARSAQVVPPPPGAAGDPLAAEEAAALAALLDREGAPFRLPVPRSPYTRNLPEGAR